jgi:ribosomal protein S18 acetylase RimI-like enzyme
VAEAAKGRGVARALLDASVDFLRNGDSGGGALVEGSSTPPPRVYLGVWSENARAIAFYKKCGFSVVGTYVPEGWAGLPLDDAPQDSVSLDCELIMRL